MQFKPDQIIVHHDSVSRAGPSFAIVNDFHRTRDFPLSSLGFYVGYHFWIERDGTVRQARAENEVGAHTIGQNYNAFGIGLAGNFDAEQPTDAQTAALGELMSGLCARHLLSKERIFPHRKYSTKTCYGKLLSDTWARDVLRDWEKKAAAPKPIAPAAGPAAAAAPELPPYFKRIAVAALELCKAVLNLSA